MRPLLVASAACAISLLGLCVFPQSQPIHGLASDLLAGSIMMLALEVATHWELLLFSILARTWHAKKSFRISAAYLIRININGEYLLIRGGRIAQFQPVGGAFKRFPGASVALGNWHAIDDQHIPIDDISSGDLRIHIRGKYLPSFRKWFDSRQDREIGVWREFREELLASSILSAVEFPSIDARYCDTKMLGPRWSVHLNTWELLVFEVFELVPNSVQKQALEKLRQARDERVLFASVEQIQRLGADPKKPEAIPIAITAQLMLEA